MTSQNPTIHAGFRVLPVGEEGDCTFTRPVDADKQDRLDMTRLAADHGAALNDLMSRHAERLFQYLVRSLQDYMGLTLPMRAKTLADREGLRLSISQHDMMISLMRGKDSWALAQLCVEHMDASKADYLARIAAADQVANK